MKHRPTRRFVFVGLLLLAIAAPVVAKDAPTDDVHITVSFENADVKEVIKEIARIAKANVIVADAVQGRISLKIDNQPWRDALAQVARASGFAMKEHDYGIVAFVPREEVELDSDYYRFVNWRPQLPEPRPDVDPASITLPFIEALGRVAAIDKGSVRYIPQQNAAVFTGHLETIETLKALMAGLDAAILQQPGAQRHPGTQRHSGAQRHPGVRHGSPASPPQANPREHLERMLQGARTEAAAKYFIERLARLDEFESPYHAKPK